MHHMIGEEKEKRARKRATRADLEIYEKKIEKENCKRQFDQSSKTIAERYIEPEVEEVSRREEFRHSIGIGRMPAQNVRIPQRHLFVAIALNYKIVARDISIGQIAMIITITIKSGGG